MAQVTSRGCSKAYMICIFYRALDYAMDCYENHIDFGWPYQQKAIDEWIRHARSDMLATPGWDSVYVQFFI